MMLTADQILAADDVQRVEVDVPEWGGTVLVQGAAENRDAYEASIAEVGDDGTHSLSLENMRAKLAAAVLVDDQGKRLFTDAQVAMLGRKSAKALDRVADAGRQVLGLDGEDEAKNG